MRSQSDRRGSTRRNFARYLVLGGLALAAGGLATTGAAAAKDLHVLNWQGYGTDEAWAVKLFEQRTGCKVVHDYFNSEQEMLTKLRTNPGTYDVVLINSVFTRQAATEGLIQPIDTSKIANWKDLSPKLRDSPYLNADGKTYGVSWVWGVTSFAYNTDVIKTKPDSIEVLWDPAHAGRVGWRDDPVEAVAFGAIAKLGEAGGCSQNLLGRMTAMDAATIKGVVDRLTKRGYVESSPSPTDRRRVLIALTAAGRKAYEGGVARALRVSSETLRALKPRERMLLLRLLKQLG